jgi:hypothetical protein
MSDDTRAELAALAARHQAELRRVQRFAHDHGPELPSSLREALDGWLTATLVVGVETLRLKHGITGATR